MLRAEAVSCRAQHVLAEHEDRHSLALLNCALFAQGMQTAAIDTAAAQQYKRRLAASRQYKRHLAASTRHQNKCWVRTQVKNRLNHSSRSSARASAAASGGTSPSAALAAAVSAASASSVSSGITLSARLCSSSSSHCPSRPLTRSAKQPQQSVFRACTQGQAAAAATFG